MAPSAGNGRCRHRHGCGRRSPMPDEALSLKGKKIRHCRGRHSALLGSRGVQRRCREGQGTGRRSAAGRWRGRDNQVHADNHDVFLTNKVGRGHLHSRRRRRRAEVQGTAGEGRSGVHRRPPVALRHQQHDLRQLLHRHHHRALSRGLALAAKGKVVFFNAFENSLRICGIRAQLAKYVLKDYPGIEIVQPETGRGLRQRTGRCPQEDPRSADPISQGVPSTPFTSPAGISRQ